jgi:hypothetical protein
MPPAYYKIVSRWEKAKDADRRKVKEWITGLVGYPCKLACQQSEDSIDIYVLSELKGEITDWLELQSNGAIGVSFDEYPDPETDEVGDLSDRCDAYNESIGVEFESDGSDEEEDEEGSEDGEEGEADKKEE